MPGVASGHVAASSRSSQNEYLRLIRAIAQGDRRPFEALYTAMHPVSAATCSGCSGDVKPSRKRSTT